VGIKDRFDVLQAGASKGRDLRHRRLSQGQLNHRRASQVVKRQASHASPFADPSPRCPNAAILSIANTAEFLTIVSMAALGLGVDTTLIGRIGGRVVAAVTRSLVVLILVSLAPVRLL